TTEAFLDFVGIRSLEELPASDVLSPRQIDAWLQEASEQRDLTEREMGLAEGERGEGAHPPEPEAAEAEADEPAAQAGEARASAEDDPEEPRAEPGEAEDDSDNPREEAG